MTGDAWTTHRTVTYVRNAERVCGVGYGIETDVVTVRQDGEERTMLRASATVHGRALGVEVYMPEGACGIRVNVTERLRVACVRELTRQAEAATA